jgi:tetratricopeptide (TPR) repeat protein
MGVNVGDIIIEDGDIFGDGVNIAARLEALAEPGGICISAAAHEQVRYKLDFSFEDMGEQQVKNIARPVRVYRVPIALTLPTPSARAASLSRIAGEGEPRRASDAVGEGKPELSLPEKPSIAVLPFQNLSGDPEQEYFADGMVEEITTANARLPWLFVIARNSAFTYQPEAAIQAIERARRLSPFDPYTFRFAHTIAISHLAARRFEQAIEWADRTLHDQPRFASAMRVKVAALAHLCRLDEARTELGRLLAINPKVTIAGFRAYPLFCSPEVLEVYVTGLIGADLTRLENAGASPVAAYS